MIELHPDLELPEFSHLYRGIGSVYLETGDKDKAIYFFEKALSIDENFKGNEHPDVVNSLQKIALYHFSNNDFGEAKNLTNRALDILKLSLGDSHPSVANVLRNLAFFHEIEGNCLEAYKLYLNSYSIFRNNIVDVTRFASPEQVSQYLKNKNHLQKVLSFIAFNHISCTNQALAPLNFLLEYKGKVLEIEREIHKKMYGSDDFQDIIDTFTELEIIRN